MKKTKHSIISNQHGGIAFLFAFSIFTLVVATGVSIEMGRIFLLRTKAFTALDAATIAAAGIAKDGITDEQLRVRAQPFFNANYPAGFMGTTRPSLRGKISYDDNTNKVTSNIAPNLKLFFGNFLPFDNVNVPVTSQVSRTVQNAEIALALDHTSSMCTDGAGNCDSTSLWQGLKDAVDLLFETVSPNNNEDKAVYYSYIPFKHTVRIDGNPVYVPGNKWKDAVNNLPTIRGLTTDTQAILNDMAAINMHRGDQGGTNTSVGTYWAWKSLRPYDADVDAFKGDSEPEDPDAHPAPFIYDTDYKKGEPPTFKYLLLLTDGNNQYFYNGRPYDDILADEYQKTYCTEIKKQGITIYTIGYGTDAKSDPIKSILEDCASSPENFFLPTDSQELKAAFEKIAVDISSLLLSQ